MILFEDIALDSPARALEFFDAIISKIKKIPLNPYVYRQKSGAKLRFRV